MKYFHLKFEQRELLVEGIGINSFLSSLFPRGRPICSQPTSKEPSSFLDKIYPIES